MSRMYDVFQRSGRLIHPRYLTSDEALLLLANAKPDVIRQARVIDVSNVSTYFFEVNDKEFWSLADFSRITPPFQYTWVEATMPKRSYSKEYGMVDLHHQADGAVRWGIFFVREDIENATRSLGFTPNVKEIELEPHEIPLKSIGAKWQVSAVLFLEGYNELFMGPVAAWDLWLDAKGDPIVRLPTESVAHKSASLRYPRGMSRDALLAYNTVGESLHKFLDVGLLALQFMNCKNVSTTLHEPPPKLIKKHEKRYGKGLCSYRTIEITPMRGYRAGDRKRGTHAVPSLHIARGHFKTFTDERPLFGKHAGTYWWEDQMRGDPRSGLSEHDYSVVP